jgi:dipeptide/tripeptide permease
MPRLCGCPPRAPSLPPFAVVSVVACEFAERFCFYGMRALLPLYVTTSLGWSSNQAVSLLSGFSSACYLSPLVGGLVSDSSWGRYKTIVRFMLVYISGATVLAVSALLPADSGVSVPGLYAGLGLVAVGTGGVKASVAAFGADQLVARRGQGQAAQGPAKEQRRHQQLEDEDEEGGAAVNDDQDQEEEGEGKPLRGAGSGPAPAADADSDLTAFFFAFYVAINCGSLLSYVLTPIIRQQLGYGPAFATTLGVLVFSLLLFLSARGQYAHVAPQGSVLARAYRIIAATWCAGGKRRRDGAGGGGGGGGGGLELAGGGGGGGVAGSAVETLPLIRAGASAGPSPTAAKSLAGGESTPAASASASSAAPLPPWLERAVTTQGVVRSDAEDIAAVVRLLPLLACIPPFWAIYDSYSALWTLQAKRMDLSFGSFTLQPEHFNVLNPLLIVLLVPPFERATRRLMLAKTSWLRPTPLRRMSVGMYLCALAWVACGLVEAAISADDDGAGGSGGPRLSVALQLPQYVILSLSELCVSTTGTEFIFRQSPPSAKGLALSVWYLATSVGDALNTALFLAAGDSSTTTLMWASTGLMLVAATVFVGAAWRFVPRAGSG